MKNLLSLIALLSGLLSCSKENPPTPIEQIAPTAYTTYTIARGEHFCDKSNIKVFSGKSIKVNVRFDSTAIYKSLDPNNQADINKLVGFTEGSNNHMHSARIGWNWSNDSLRTYAYAYMQGQRKTQFISIVKIGSTIQCSIEATGTHYVFTVGQQSVKLPRSIKDELANGYWQYPYFGGDEVAPHDISINIEYL